MSNMASRSLHRGKTSKRLQLLKTLKEKSHVEERDKK